MTTNKNLAAMTREQHGAWLDSLSDTDLVICHVPVGYLYTTLVISLLKRTLLVCPMDTGERLEILEQLNGLATGPISPIALSLIAPMCDTAYRMVEAACQLDPPDEYPYPEHDPDALNRTCPGRKSFAMLTSWEVFGHLRRLNPSIDEALLLCFSRGVLPRTRAN